MAFNNNCNNDDRAPLPSPGEAFSFFGPEENSIAKRLTKLLAPGHNFPADSYYAGLYNWLSSAPDYRTFKLRAIEHINKLGFSDWGYVRTDLPADQTSEEIIGTNNKQYRETYVSEQFYADDLLMRHGTQSTNAAFLSALRGLLPLRKIIKDDLIDRNCEIIKLTNQTGHNDVLLMPFTSISSGHIAMTVCAKKVSAENFKRRVAQKSKELAIFARVVDRVGTENHPTVFVAKRTEYEQMSNSNAIEYLRLSHYYDYNRKEIADLMCRFISSVEKYANAAREFFHVKTDHHAIEMAINEGYFERRPRKPSQ